MEEKTTRRGKEFKKFEDLARKLVRVLKEEINKAEKKAKEEKKKG